MTGIFSSIGFNRKTLFIGLVIVLVIANLIIILSEVDTREFYSIRIIVISSIMTTVLAIFILYRQRINHGSLQKADLSLAIAMSLSLCSELIWIVYEVILDIVPPIPSVADVISLSAYAFLAFYVFSTYFRFHKVFHFDSRNMVITIIAVGIFLSYILYTTIGIANFSSDRGIAMFSILVAYPILDSIIMVPSFLIILNYRKEPLWFTPWICKSAGIFLIASSDSWFAIFIISSLTTELWPSALIIASHNLILAGGLLWYIKFLVKYKDVDCMINYSDTKTTQNKKKIVNEKHIQEENDRLSRPEKYKKRSVIMTTIAILSILTTFIVIIIVVINYSSQNALFSPLLSNFYSDPLSVTTHASNPDDRIKIGALLPITGVASSTGKSTLEALKIALEDINNYFSDNNSGIRYELLIEDTESNPSKSLEKLKRLYDKHDTNIVIGPGTSTELRAVKDYANENNILLLSHSSTAPSLAIEGDNVFRFVPDDTHQAQVISEFMWNDGIRVVVPFWRNDVYGNELINAVKADFELKGGIFNNNSLGYVPKIGELESSLQRINFVIWDRELRSLDNIVQQSISKYGTQKVGVYLVSLDEVTPIFIEAHSYPSLSKVKWYGSDGSVLNEKLAKNHDSAHFAVNTSFYNPIYSVNLDNPDLKNLENEIHLKTGVEPSPYSVVAYDVLWIAALAENHTRYLIGLNDASSPFNNTVSKEHISYLREQLINVAKSFNGVTGNTTLNAKGDRLESKYDFWSIINVPDSDKESYIWEKVN